MVEYIKPIMESKGVKVNTEERNLISVAFKNMISSKRTAWRSITAIE